MRRAVSDTSGHYYRQVSERINALLDRNGVLLKGRVGLLKDITGQSRQWIANMVAGTGVEIPVLTLARIAAFFGCRLEELAGVSIQETEDQTASSTPAWVQALELAGDETAIKVLRLTNDQMESDSPEGLRRGDSVIYDTSDTDVCRGGLFVLGDRLTVRRVDIQPDGQVGLIPINVHYSTSTFATIDEMRARVPIAGKVVALVHSL